MSTHHQQQFATVKLQESEIIPSGFFLLRTPLLPFNQLQEWANNTSSASISQTDARPEVNTQAWVEDIAVLRSRLQSIVTRPAIRQALFVASPSLEQSLDRWFRDPDCKKGLQTERSLVRYFARMAARSTPFGFFAGCSLGHIDVNVKSTISLAPMESYCPNSSLGFEYLDRLTKELERSPNISEELLVAPNSTLYQVGATWRYLDISDTGDDPSYRLVTVSNDFHLNVVIERARHGATIKHVASALSNICSLPLSSAVEYVSELVEARLLQSSLSPLTTGATALDDLIEQLMAIPTAAETARTLCKARELLVALDAQGIGVPVGRYSALSRMLGSLSCSNVQLPPIQVGLYKPLVQGMLDTSVVDDLVGAAQFLCNAHSDRAPYSAQLRRFGEAFLSRFGARWVMLAEALDPEVGIGFPVRTFNSQEVVNPELPSDLKRNDRELTLLQKGLLHKLLDRKRDPTDDIVLDPSDSAERGSGVTLPRAFSLVACISATSSADLAAGRFQLLFKGGSGPSGAALLGRFCRLNPAIETSVRRHISQEESIETDAVYAEIVHVPAKARLGDIISRPILRTYEIPLFSRSGCKPSCQLPISDLWVTVTENRRIHLYSRRLNKRVIPRLSSAHAFNLEGSVPAYHFLAAFQYEAGTVVPVFDWGALANTPFLPRVRMGRVIFAAARWKIFSNEVDKVARRERHEEFFAFQDLRGERKLPRWINFIEPHGALCFDLDNPLSVDSLVHLLKRRKEGLLEEMFPDPHNLWVDGPEGRFSHEIIVPFVDTSPQVASSKVGASLPASIRVSESDRTFTLGSEWLYVKAFGGRATLDEFLVTALLPLVRAAVASGQISHWFFVRYADPSSHLRIRFRLVCPRSYSDLVNRIRSLTFRWTVDHLIWKIEFACYEREIERYGGLEGLLVSEAYFTSDSAAVLSVLEGLPDRSDVDQRFQVAVLGVNTLLTDFGFTANGLSRLADTLRTRSRDRMSRQYGQLKKNLDRSFRIHRPLLEQALNSTPPGLPLFTKARMAFVRRSEETVATRGELAKLSDAGVLCRPLIDIVASYAHMHINRLLSVDTALSELAIYDFLARLYHANLMRPTVPEPAST